MVYMNKRSDNPIPPPKKLLFEKITLAIPYFDDSNFVKVFNN